MAAAFPKQVSAVQVGTFFLRQYYNILQQQPSIAYQFYSDGSSVVRMDVHGRIESANGTVDIHSLIMSMNFTEIEIKTASFLNSWDDGVLVTVSGLVQSSEYSGRRRFFQTIFLAPQEKGYFILNDVFCFAEDEQVHQSDAYENLEGTYDEPNANTNSVPDHLHDEENPMEEVHYPDMSGENGIAVPDNSYSELQYATQTEELVAEQHFVEEPNVSTQKDVGKEPLVFVEQPAGEPQKHTYASILKVKTQFGNVPAQPAPLATPPLAAIAEPRQASQPYTQQLTTAEKIISDEVCDSSACEDEVESKSLYVGNVPASVSEVDLENEFKKFGKLGPDGVAIRSRKESGGYYAFVEFDDVSGVHNALKASTIEVKGYEIYVEERRPSNGAFRGGRRGRGRVGGYQQDAARGRFGGRAQGRAGMDMESNNQSGRGYYQRISRNERVY